MKMIAFVLSFVAQAAFAAPQNYTLKLDIVREGHHVAAPTVVATEGQVAKVTNGKGLEKIELEITPMMKSKGVVNLQIVANMVSWTNKKNLIQKIDVTTKENEPAKASVTDVDGKEAIAISVIVSSKAATVAR